MGSPVTSNSMDCARPEKKNILAEDVHGCVHCFLKQLFAYIFLVQVPGSFQGTEKGENYSVGIVLGGFVSYDESNKAAFFSQASDRFIQAARLYKLGHISKIVVTGGNAFLAKNSKHNEAEFVKSNLIDLGIPSDDIMTEKKRSIPLKMQCSPKESLTLRISGNHIC